MTDQLAFSFDAQEAQETAGIDLWRETRRVKLRELEQKLGLPIGARVRVQLASGIIVEGRLAQAEEHLWISTSRADCCRLRIGAVDFLLSEIASCIRLDG